MDAKMKLDVPGVMESGWRSFLVHNLKTLLTTLILLDQILYLGEKLDASGVIGYI